MWREEAKKSQELYFDSLDLFRRAVINRGVLHTEVNRNRRGYLNMWCVGFWDIPSRSRSIASSNAFFSEWFGSCSLEPCISFKQPWSG